MELKEQKFGIEIELTGITREKAAEVAADYLGTGTVYHRNLYDKYYAMDHSGREWSFVRDRSISQQKHVRGNDYDVSDDVRDSLKTEMVTPICGYEDIERSRVLSGSSETMERLQIIAAVSMCMWMPLRLMPEH